MRGSMLRLALSIGFAALAAEAAAQSGAPGFAPGMMADCYQGRGYHGQMHSGWQGPWGRGGGMGAVRFGAIDENANGIIEADEAAAHAEDVFTMMDDDGDEALTLDEYLSAHMGFGPGHGPRHEQMQGRKQARFKDMDKNTDGKVDKAEFLDDAAKRFASADRDKDGKVTAWEFRRLQRP